MLNLAKNIIPGAQQADQTGSGELRKPYLKPKLEQLGDLRTITLGGSNQVMFDSGYPDNPFGDYTYMN